MRSETIKLIAKLKDELTGPLGRTGQRMRQFGRSATRAAAMVGVLATAIVAAAKKLADYGAAIQDMSDFSGIGVESLQGLIYGIEQAGGSSQNLSMALRTQARFIGYLEQGMASYTQYLDDLGLTYEQLAGLSPEETFLTLTDALAGVQDEVKRTEIGMVMFGGRGMSSILAAMEQFDGSLRNAQDQFGELGAALSEEQIANLKKFSDAMTDLGYRFRAFLADAVVPLLPTIQGAGERFLDIAEDKLPKMIEAVSNAIPVLVAMIDILAVAADGWEKLLSKDVEGEIDTATEALNQLAESLQSQVAAGLISSEEAMRAYIKESENMITASTSNVLEQTVLRESTRGLAEDFLFAELQLRSLLGMMGATEGLERLGESFEATGQNIVGLLIDADALSTALAEVSMPTVEPTAAPGTGTAEDRESAKTYSEYLKELALERIESEHQAKLESAAAIQQAEADNAESLRQHRIDEKTERIEAEAEIAAARMRFNEQVASRLQSELQSFGSSLIMSAEDWEKRMLAAIAKVALEAAAISVGGPIGGVLGFIGGLFQKGGTVQHTRTAQTGTVVPDQGPYGDKWPYWLERGEKVTSREQGQMTAAESRPGVSVQVNLHSLYSSLNSLDTARFGNAIITALKERGIDV